MSVNTSMHFAVNRVMRYGRESRPRGKLVRELLAERIEADMTRPLVTQPSRNLGYRFAPAEAAWILSGDNRVDTIRRYSKFIWEFSDDLYFYNGAYGPKIVDQLTYACDVIVDDRDTRQSVIDIWRPNPRTSKDIPCTLSYQFLVREGKLHVVQTMRSGDAWLGYPYDAFNASMLAGYVMLLLKKRAGIELEVGSHTMQVGSLHVYEKDWPGAEEFLRDDRVLFACPRFDPLRQFQEPQHLVDHLWRLAAQTFSPPLISDWLVDELREVSRLRTGSNT